MKFCVFCGKRHSEKVKNVCRIRFRMAMLKVKRMTKLLKLEKKVLKKSRGKNEKRKKAG